LGAFTFVALFPYMLNIIRLLKPGSIIKRLAIEITKDKIINSEEDPIQPIMDIIHGSIRKYDLETTRVGLKKVTKQVIGIIDSDGEEEISGRFCKHLERVGKLAVSSMDGESTEEVIENFEWFGKSTAKKGLESATANTIMFLKAVGVTAMEKGLVVATWRAVESMGVVGEAAVEKGLEKATQQAARYLGHFGRSTAEKGLLGKTKQIARTLEDIGKAAIAKGLKGATGQVIKSLIDIGIATSPIGKLEDATRHAAKSLAELTISSEEIVKEAIQDYESELKEQDRDTFQKFMEIYKQEVERLGAGE
ncbi:MAG: hypothetical protein IMF19_15870, partial [Proteobacteria bacterium]|nr:hypothetical protein [Pseudomonadota bacterium]